MSTGCSRACVCPAPRVVAYMPADVFGRAISSSNAALVITFCDILYTALFLAFINYFNRFIHNVRAGLAPLLCLVR